MDRGENTQQKEFIVKNTAGAKLTIVWDVRGGKSVAHLVTVDSPDKSWVDVLRHQITVQPGATVRFNVTVHNPVVRQNSVGAWNE